MSELPLSRWNMRSITIKENMQSKRLNDKIIITSETVNYAS